MTSSWPPLLPRKKESYHGRVFVFLFCFVFCLHVAQKSLCFAEFLACLMFFLSTQEEEEEEEEEEIKNP